MNLKSPFLRAILAAVFLIFSHAVFAQALTITSPLNDARLPAGPDYATEVLGDPWDMSNPEDISIDPDDRSGWATFAFPGDGTVGGTTAPLAGGGIDTTIMFLNRGYHNIINPGRTGREFPIDTTVYRKIAFRMRSGIAGELPAVYWFHTSPGDPANSPDPLKTLGTMFTQLTIAGNKIFTANLSQAPALGAAWTAAPVVGLRLDPNGSKAGQDVFFDWVRLTRSDTDPQAAILPIAWSGGSGNATVEVVDANGTVLTIATNLAATSINWNYGVLPPGNYTLRVTRGTIQNIAFSINNPPLIRVTDPDETGGEDFATTVLSNPWDMNESADVAGTANVTNISFSGGVFSGTNAALPLVSDPIVVLHNSNTTVIDTSKYRFLTYRMQLDGPYDLSPEGGSVARVFWSSTIDADASLMTTTKDIIVWPGTVPGTPGFVTYTIDLGQLSTAINGGLESIGAQQVWSAANIRHFRIDPHEFIALRRFHIDNVRLAAMREASGSFVIRYVASDADLVDSGATVKLYYALDKNPAARQLIASSLPLSPDGQYIWDISSVAPGTYYIYAEVSDGFNTSGLYSSGQLRVIGVTQFLPGAPSITAIVSGNAQASVSFAAPATTGASPITGYTVTCNPGAITATGAASPIVVTGLTNGILYTCSMTATNSAGTGPASANVNVTPSAAAPLTLVSVVSRKTHGASGAFDVTVDTTQPIGGTITVEPRQIGAGHSLVFLFNGAITATGTASMVDALAAPVGTATPALSGNNVVVTLTGVPDNQRVTVSLTNVNNAGVNASASMGFLVGDLNNSRSVTATDILQVKGRSGQVTDAANFKFDLNGSGSITASDILAVKGRSGLVLP